MLQLQLHSPCLPCKRPTSVPTTSRLSQKILSHITSANQTGSIHTSPRLLVQRSPVLPRHTACAAASGAPSAVQDDKLSSSVDFAIALATIADETKADDISLLHVAPLVSWTSYMLVVSVFSRPQLLACIARMEKEAAETWQREKQNQPGSSPWELLDYGDVVVHVFTPEQREYYDIESFYAAAEEVDLPFEQQEQQGQQSRTTGQWTTRM